VPIQESAQQKSIIGCTPMKRGLFTFVVLLLLLGFTVAVDRLLGLLGYPGEYQGATSAPPYYRREIKDLEYQYVLQTNDRGIRYPTIPLTKPAGTYRIAVLGDSFTEGTGVLEEQRFTNLIESRLRTQDGIRVDLVNCGEAGTAPFDYGRKLFQTGLAYQPDAVLICLYFNDVTNTPPGVDASQMYSEAPKPRRAGIRQVAHACWPHVYSLLREFLSHTKHNRQVFQGDLVARVKSEVVRRGIEDWKFQVWLETIPPELVAAVNAGQLSPNILTYPLTRPEYFTESLDLGTPAAQAKWDSVCRILQTICEQCRAKGVEVAVVLIPPLQQYDAKSPQRLQCVLYLRLGAPMRAEWLTETSKLQSSALSWAAQNDVPFLDLCPAFRASAASCERPLNFLIDPHWTPEGHKVAADEIYRWLKESRVFAFLRGSAD
jgi:hypothetical protein